MVTKAGRAENHRDRSIDGATAWLLLLYTVPRQPSALRVAIWRKLRTIGAVLLHDSAWMLPNQPRTLEHFQWLRADIQESGGEARLLCCTTLGEDGELRERFLAQVDEEFGKILAELAGKSPDRAALSKKYQQASVRDYFHSTLGKRVREMLERRSLR